MTEAGVRRSTAYADDRAHVFHSWSAQGALGPGRGRRRRGLVVLGRGRQPLPRLLLAARQPQHRPPAPAGRGRDQGAGRPAVHGRARLRQRRAGRGGPADRRAARPATWPRCSSPTAAPRRTRTRSAWPGRHRPAQGAGRPTAATTAPPARRSRSPATRAAGRTSRACPASCASSGPYPYRSSFHADLRGPGVRAGAAPTSTRCSLLEGPHTVAAIILETVVGTNGILVPPDGYLAGVRELCDRHGIAMICDEVMAGFGRCGEWFAVDRWGVVPDLITFAKGVNSGYVPARRRRDARRGSPTPSPSARSPAASPTPGTRWPARPRSPRSRRWTTRASSSTPAASATR